MDYYCACCQGTRAGPDPCSSGLELPRDSSGLVHKTISEHGLLRKGNRYRSISKHLFYLFPNGPPTTENSYYGSLHLHVTTSRRLGNELGIRLTYHHDQHATMGACPQAVLKSVPQKSRRENVKTNLRRKIELKKEFMPNSYQ